MLNGIAWVQASAMIHYATGGERTLKPEQLSVGEKAWTIVSGVKVPRPENSRNPRDAGLNYSTREIPVNGSERLEAWFVPASGARGLALMFPGYASSKDSLMGPASALDAMDYDLLMVDFRGAGGSSGQDTTIGVREGEDVDAALEYARRQWPDRQVALYGVSMGSAAILRAVAADGARPDVVILESPFNSLLDTTANRFHSMGLPAFPSAQLIVFWGSVQKGFNGFKHNPENYASSITCPALLLYGEHDPRVTPAQSRAIFDRLGGPKQAISFSDAGHQLLINSDPALWKSEVARFLGGANR